jgi:hypothetical protein
MPRQKISVPPVLIILTVGLVCAARAGEISWVLGESSPPQWSVQPSEPNETDLIRFWGPTRFYANQFLAEQALGGKPVLQIDTVSRKIQLRFEPPARGRADATQSVCGLQGYFGPLEQGTWQFFCTQPSAAFSLRFEVRGQAISAVYYVDARATRTQDGSSWTNAFAQLQDILAIAGPGSEIRVAQGVYRPDRGTGLRAGDDTAAFILKSGIVLKGGYAGLKAPHPDERDVAAHESVLSGDLLGNDDPSLGPKGLADHPSRSDNSLHVMMILGTDSTVVLDGFTITGGNAFIRERAGLSSYGGGLYIEAASPSIRHCLITGNAAADYGGGIYARGQGVSTLIDCVIADNWSGGLGGGVFVNWDGEVRMERCFVSGNVASLYGGGLSCYANGSLRLSNSILSGNVTVTPRYGAGGGLYCSLATAALNHCTLVGNSAAVGPDIACRSTDPSQKSKLSVTNCILWDPGSIANQDGSTIEITYSDVYGGWTGPGNLNVEPGLLAVGHWDPGPNPTNPADDTWSDGDYHLAWGSPCVDAGDPCDVADLVQMDFAGLPRFSGLQVDMGAYELKNDPPLADAGPDVAGFSLTGDTGTVALDARRSLDPEGRPLNYAWYRAGMLVSSLPQFTIDLPLGEHVFTLIVNDGTLDSTPDEVLARVSRPVRTQAMVSPEQMVRRTSLPIQALAVLPQGRRITDFDATQPLVLLPGNIKAAAQSAFPWFHGQVLVLARFKRADLMAAVPANGMTQVTVVGRLKDGTYFAGTDSVNIK